jgi:uncharacterized membrane protein
VKQLQIWRLYTSTFVHGGLLGLFFALLSFIPRSIEQETEKGTVPFAIRFVKFSIFINVVICALAFIGELLPFLGMEGLMYSPAAGLWPLYMMDLVIKCYEAPDAPARMPYVPIQIKQKYYPLVVLA